MSDVLISTSEYGTGGGRPLTMHLRQVRQRPDGLGHVAFFREEFAGR